MRPSVAEGYVLRTWKLGEADLVVSLFTREEGILRGVARAARRSRRRFGGALEPLTRVRVRFVERPSSDLARLEELEPIRSYFGAQSDPAVAAAFAYVAEMVEQFGREKEADDPFFRLVGAVAEGLDRGVDPLLAARYFEAWTLRLQGLLPDLRICPSCERPLTAGGWYDRRHGEVSCARCLPPASGGERIEPGVFALAGSILTRPLDAVHECRPAPATVAGLGSLLAGILARFLERPFRSLRILEGLSA
ncbi:MAG: DNA repair protein RecO [Acidobacteriota bacterium]|jgi:DNA repair protein RecO (recombination protein O)